MFWDFLALPKNTPFFLDMNNPASVIFGASYLTWIILFFGVLMAIAVHEFSHAFVAYRLGDPTAKNLGRLTLNPLKHFDVLGLFLIMLSRFGYGKPVPINPNNFVNPAKGNMAVALAGPMSNFLQAFLFAILFLALKQIPPFTGSFESIGSIAKGTLTTFTYTLPYLGLLNISLGLFNLLPIFPLDGSHIWGYFNYKISEFIYRISPYSMFILIALIFPIFGNQSLLSLIFEPFQKAYLSLVNIL